MPDRTFAITKALDLVREALELLDSVDAGPPAVHLQHAIDVMTEAPIPGTEREAEELLRTPECVALLHRLGFGTGVLH